MKKSLNFLSTWQLFGLWSKQENSNTTIKKIILSVIDLMHKTKKKVHFNSATCTSILRVSRTRVWLSGRSTSRKHYCTPCFSVRSLDHVTTWREAPGFLVIYTMGSFLSTHWSLCQLPGEEELCVAFFR
jgi:hypothetical protein